MNRTSIFISFLLAWVIVAILIPQRTWANINENENVGGIILAYHRIGEDAYPDTNIRLDQFYMHIDEISDGSYNIVALPDLIDTLKERKDLPAKTIALTFEGAYRSAYENAFPVLLEKKIPFTIIYSSGQANNDTNQHLNWRELKTLSKNNLVHTGILPDSYTRLNGMPKGKILEQINRARIQHREHFGQDPDIFSYPFGEYSAEYRDIVQNQDFTASLTLHSGVAWHGSDFMALPRFSITESYGGIDRFKLIANTLPMAAYDIEPQDPFIQNNDVYIGFSLSPSLAKHKKSLSCFISGQNNPKIEFVGANRIEIRPNEPINENRTRLNCTMPEYLDQNTVRWRWFGLLLTR